MYQKDINITNDYLDLVSLESIGEYSNWVSQLGTNWFYEDNEHYKLLAYLSMFFENETIVDIGTYRGLSALAMSYNHKNFVITYDIVDNFDGYKNELTVEKKANIECRIKDCRDDVELFKNTNLVMLDVDPHDGIQEKDFFKFFEEIGYNGLVILDDIYICENMTNFWNNIKQPKINITKYGHWSGTGLVQFGNLFNITVS